jgi:DNA (cytosine-5)-methyltransferase 1
MFLDKWRKLMADQPSWTVPAHLSKDTYSHIHHDSDQARMISVREAARLQSFPDQFRFQGNMGDCYRQIGNAVPPLLAWSIASTLLHLLGYNETEVGNR